MNLWRVVKGETLLGSACLFLSEACLYSQRLRGSERDGGIAVDKAVSFVYYTDEYWLLYHMIGVKRIREKINMSRHTRESIEGKTLREVTANEAWLRKYPERTVLAVSTDGAGRPNIITLGWNMPTSGTPPMAVISIGVTRYSHRLIHEGGEFVLVFPSIEIEEEVAFE